MDKVSDEVFGEMQYSHSWKKKQKLNFWGRSLDIDVKAAAYSNQHITAEQRKSYLKFLKNIDKISEETLEIASKYIKNNYSKCNSDEVTSILNPRTVLFKQDGSCGILCDFSFDVENGIVIVVYPNYDIGVQDIFL